MKNTIGKFGYTITMMDDRTQLPFDPFIVIDLEHWGQSKGGSPVLSPNLVSTQEVDEYLQQLKDDLDQVASSAKLALTRARGRTKEIIKKRVETKNV